MQHRERSSPLCASQEYMCPFRLQKEVEMNMKKLLTTTFITAFFIISSAFFASAEETDLSEPVQQTEEAANDQGQQETEAAKTTEEPASHLVSLGVFKTTGYCHAATVLQVGAEVPAPVLLPAPVTLLPLTQELSLMEPRL